MEALGYREPVQIVVDATFLVQISKTCNALKQVRKLFRHPPKLFVPSCEYSKYTEIRRGKTGAHSAVKTSPASGDQQTGDFSGHCEIMECAHKPEESCVTWLLRGNNKHHYVLGLGDVDKIRAIKQLGEAPVLKALSGTVALDIGTLKAPEKHLTGRPAKQRELNNLARLLSDEAVTARQEAGKDFTKERSGRAQTDRRARRSEAGPSVTHSQRQQHSDRPRKHP